MMWQLIAAVLLMLLISAVFIGWPRRASTINHQTAAQLFEERLQLLVTARDSGELADSDFVTAANELKTQFMQQEQKAVKLRQPKHKVIWHIALVVVLAVIVGVTYSMNGHYRQLSDWELAQQNLAEYGERALLNQGEALSEHEVTLFALALRTRLHHEGDDAMAWMLLGRIWMSQGLMLDAIDAYERALKLTPNRTALLISYSQALIVVGGDENLAKAGRSVARVLTAEPENIDAISLMALIAYEKGDNKEAIEAWTLLLQKLPQDDPRYAVVSEKLQELNAITPDSVPGREIIVKLTVDPSLKVQHPDASLFLFARAVNGPALPLAVQRIPLPSGEIQLSLTEDMLMQQGWSLANVDEVQVVARMSLAGTVEQRPGDIQTISPILSFSDAKLTTVLILEP